MASPTAVTTDVDALNVHQRARHELALARESLSMPWTKRTGSSVDADANVLQRAQQALALARTADEAHPKSSEGSGTLGAIVKAEAEAKPADVVEQARADAEARMAEVVAKALADAEAAVRRSATPSPPPTAETDQSHAQVSDGVLAKGLQAQRAAAGSRSATPSPPRKAEKVLARAPSSKPNRPAGGLCGALARCLKV